MKRFMFLLIIIGFCLAVTDLSAQALTEKPGVNKLDNGLTVVTLPWNSPGMTSYYTLVRTGSRDETDKNHTGFAHLFEHLMFRGTKAYPKDVYEAKIQEFGADNNAFTWLDLTCFTVTLPSSVLPEIIKIEADRFRNLEYSEADFKTETGAVLGEYGMGASNPSMIMNEKLSETAFKRHTYGHTTIGYIKDVKNMPKYYKYSKRFHKWFYTPDNVTIIVAGDFDKAALLKNIEAAYGSWKGKRKKTVVKKEKEQTTPRFVHVEWEGASAPKMTVAYKIPAFKTNADSAALEILSHLVFGETSPLYKKLVLNEQKVVSMSASHGIFAPLSRDPHLFRVNLTLKDGVTFKEIEDEITAAIAHAADGQISTERIDEVKSHSRYGFELSLETPGDVAVTIAMLMSATGDPDSVDKFVQALSATTPDDIKKVASSYLTEKRRTVVTLAPKEGGAK